MITFEIPRVIDVRHCRDYVLWLRFSDGVEGEVDLSDDLTRPLSPTSPVHGLRDHHLFAQARVEAGTVAWPNGVDWAPETLYDGVLEAKGERPQSEDDAWSALLAHIREMPEISRFFGIVIRMFYTEHVRPHFHAHYGEHTISIEIEGQGMRGSFPPARLPLVYEWRDLHRAELLDNWERMRRHEAPRPIPPLE